MTDSSFNDLNTEQHEGTSLIASQLRDLLAQSGVSPRKQTTWLADLLQLSYPAARRKLFGDTSWNDDELRTVLGAIGFEYNGLMGISRREPGASESTAVVNAQVEVQGLQLTCEVELRAPPRRPPAASDSLAVVTSEDGTHRVVRTMGAPAGLDLNEVVSLKICPAYASTGPRVALLDDEETLLDMVSRALSVSGFRVEQFQNAEELLTRSSSEPFDAYVCDWTLGNGRTVESCLSTLRSLSPTAPIVIMSGRFDEAGVDSVVARAADMYQLIALSKPTPVFTLVRQILGNLHLEPPTARPPSNVTVPAVRSGSTGRD